MPSMMIFSPASAPCSITVRLPTDGPVTTLAHRDLAVAAQGVYQVLSLQFGDRA
jgi:hypothetical protein